MKTKFRKIPGLLALIFAVSVWVFSLLKIGQILNLVHIPVVADTGIFVQSTAQSQVSGGQGKASMSVTTDVNGDKQQVTSDKPGEIKITVEDGKTTKEVNTSPRPSPSPTASLSPSPSPTVDNQFQQMQNDLEKMWQDLLSKLSAWFNFKSQ